MLKGQEIQNTVQEVVNEHFGNIPDKPEIYVKKLLMIDEKRGIQIVHCLVQTFGFTDFIILIYGNRSRALIIGKDVITIEEAKLDNNKLIVKVSSGGTITGKGNWERQINIDFSDLSKFEVEYI